MKKVFLLILLSLVIINNFDKNIVYAKSNIDDSINGILDGIDYELYDEFNNSLNEFFKDDLSFKDRIIKFLTGEANISFETVTLFFKTKIFNLFNNYKRIIFYIIFIGIACTILNVIISKNSDNNAKSTIFYICYLLVISVSIKLIYELFLITQESINSLCKKSELIFPLMFSISSLCGNFGVSLYKPLTCFASFFSANITSNYLMPILMFGAVSLVIGNLSDTIKLQTLSSTIFSVLKWCLGLIGIIYTVILAVQGIVNSQYNGLSVKILKYTTGSMVPIIGGFLSSGMDVLLSSAVLIKNSIGLLGVIYVLISIGGVGISLLVLSIIIKISASIAEPLLDKKFLNVFMGISTIINYLIAIAFLCGYIYFITVLGFIFSTISII